MRLLFSIITKEKIVLDKVYADLIPELSCLSHEQLMFVILAYDYNSPFNQLIEEEKINKAKMQVYGNLKEGVDKIKKVKLAIQIYKGLQSDPRRDSINVYRSKMDYVNKQLEAEKDMSKLKMYMDANSKLRTAINDIEVELDLEVNSGVGEDNTFLENFQYKIPTLRKEININELPTLPKAKEFLP